VFLLLLTAAMKWGLTAWTFGMMVSPRNVSCNEAQLTRAHQVPAGIFLPTIAIGACVGRAVGMIMYVLTHTGTIYVWLTFCDRQELHRTYPRLWIFINSCPPDPSARCVSPGFYAVIGASSMLGGTTRMTSCVFFLLRVRLFTHNNQSLAGRHSLRANGCPVPRSTYYDQRHDL